MKIQSKLRRPIATFKEFLKLEAFAGGVLICVTILSLLLTNLPTGSIFISIWKTTITLFEGEFSINFALIDFINDGLMTLFFFVVGLEIKRELIGGELSGKKRAALPVIAATGGMIFPALFYLLMNTASPAKNGWAIPTATDIAFVVGILMILKSKIPPALKVFLTALAIVDDIGAVLIIALFFTKSISVIPICFIVIILAVLLIVNQRGIKAIPVYTILGFFLWAAFLYSGIHATISGVILAFTIPIYPADPESHQFMDTIDKPAAHTGDIMLSPLHRCENALHPWVSYLIIPLFAFSNAGVVIDFNISKIILHPVSLGIIIGLFAGKQIGIFFFTIAAIRLGIADPLPKVTKLHFYGASVLGGIGFTMSIFISTLSFQNNEEFLNISRLGILCGSILSGIIGYILLRIKVNNNSETVG